MCMRERPQPPRARVALSVSMCRVLQRARVLHLGEVDRCAGFKLWGLGFRASGFGFRISGWWSGV